MIADDGRNAQLRRAYEDRKQSGKLAPLFDARFGYAVCAACGFTVLSLLLSSFVWGGA